MLHGDTSTMASPESDSRDELERADTHTVSWFELFYDLVVVAAVSLCNDAYLEHPSVDTAVAALLSIAALSWIWLITTVFNNLFPGDDLIRRLVLLVQMGCIVVAALAVDQVEGLSNSTGLVAYGLAMLIVAILVLRERTDNRHRALIRGGVTPILISATICFAGAAIAVGYAAAFLGAALAVSVGSLLAARLHTPAATASIRVDHLRERRGLFILIILGEGFAELVHALNDLGSIPRGGIFGLTFLLAFALWWIYFDGTFSERPGQAIVHWRLSLLAHLTLIYGLAGTLDLLVLLTVQEEQTLGDASLLYFAVSLAAVFGSFAILGFSARGRFGSAGWIQLGSALVVLVIGALATAGDDQSVTAVMVAAVVLVVGNAVLAVWADRSTDTDGWRATLRAVIKGSDSSNDLLD